MMLSFQWAALLCALATSSAAAGSVPISPTHNLDFEQGVPGIVPSGWFAAGAHGGFTAALSRTRPHGGQGCLEIRRDKVIATQFCFVRQAIDASPYRGHRVRLSGWLRFEPSDSAEIPGSSARIWVRSGGHPWSYDGLEAHPVSSANWTFAQVTCEVAPDADSIAFGGTLYLNGRAFFDDMKLAVVGRSGEGNEPARPLGERGVENLVAFARLLGYVRHFHPSDEAATTDWDQFAIMGVNEVEGAPTPADLKERLERLLRPIAPTLRLSTKPLAPLQTAAMPRPGGAHERIVGWQHRGWPGPNPGYYEQRRILAPAAAPGDSLLPIGSEVNAGLGGGVWCSVPLTLYTSPVGTLPRGVGRAPKLKRPDGWVPTGNDRSTRVAAVILFWNVMQHFFPYFDVTGTDWRAELPHALQAAAADSDGAEFDVTLRRLAAKLQDGHTGVASPYWDPEGPHWPFAWSFVEDRLVLVRADAALAGGARIGDEVLAIQGRPTSEWIRDAEAQVSGATPQRTRLKAAQVLAVMIATDTLMLDLRSPAGVSHRVRVAQHRGASLQPALPDSIREVRPGIMYLDLNRITDADLEAALPKINTGRGVVFDLRGYPNRTFRPVIAHLTDSTVTSPRWGFPIIMRPDHRDTTCEWENWSVEPMSPRIRARAAFLIDGRAISAAETLLGIVEHHRLADLVGEPTSGTNGVVTSVLLPGRYSVSFTGMKVLKHDGSRLHGIGILPTVPVSPTVAGVAAGRDEQLMRAIDVVRGSEFKE